MPTTDIEILRRHVELADRDVQALEHADAAGLIHVASEEYELETWAGSLETLRRRMLAVDPARAERFDAHRDELERRFANLGEPHDGGRRFTERIRAVVLSDLLGSTGT